MHLRRRYHFILLFLFANACFTMQAGAQKSNLRNYLSEKIWNELFPNRVGVKPTTGKKNKQAKGSDFYSYRAFLAAADSFRLFLAEPDITLQKRELCAFLANIAYETGGGWDEAPGGYYKWGLYYKEEIACAKGCPQYSDTSKKKYPPVNGQSYHGRGPLQLSWNYNYGQFSETYLHNKEILLKDPALVSRDPVICFASALWFWTTAQFPKPSCHEIMSNQWKPTAKDTAGGRMPGFGAVLNVINGGIECGAKAPPDTRYRYGYYLYFCKYFNVDPGPNVYCSSQKAFGQ
ncbi:MAG: chitinase [Bacteroidota bacterium]